MSTKRNVREIVSWKEYALISVNRPQFNLESPFIIQITYLLSLQLTALI